MPAEASKTSEGGAKDEPIYVFGTDHAGQHKSESALLAVTLHGAQAGKGSGASGRAYAIPYRNSTGELLALNVIENYVAPLLELAKHNPNHQFTIARFGCEAGAYEDAVMAELFARAPRNCTLPGLWKRILDATIPVRMILFDPAANFKKTAWQRELKQHIDLNAPLWGTSTVDIVSVGAPRTLAANDAAAKTLGLKHRIIGANEDRYGRNAAIAAEARAIWYSTHLLSVFDFDMTAQPSQIRIVSAATRGGLTIHQVDTNQVQV